MQISLTILIIIGIIELTLYSITPSNFRRTKISNQWFRSLLPFTGIYLFITYLNYLKKQKRLKSLFIPYEDCKTLRKMGFNEPCYGYFAEINGGEIEFFQQETSQNDNLHLLRPTYEQAYKFLLNLKFDTQ